MTSSEANWPDAAALREAEDFCRQRRTLFYPKTDTPLPDDVLRDLRRADRPRELADPGLIADVCRQALRVDAARVTPLPAQGTFHVLYRVELAAAAQRATGAPSTSTVILRANALSQIGRDFQLYAERWAADAARAANLPTARVLHVDLSHRLCPFDYAIMEEAPGHSLGVFDHDDVLLLPGLRELGCLVAQLHAIRRPGFGWLDVRPLVQNATGPCDVRGLFDHWSDYVFLKLDQHIRTCVDIEAIDADEARRIEEAFAALNPLLPDVEPALLHGDLGNHNIFTDGRRITALLDWEDCLLGDPTFDIAFWATFHPDRRHATFLDGYRSGRPLPADFDLRFWLYYLRVALSKTVHRWRFGYPDRPDRAPASRRIPHALAKLEEAS